MTPPPRTDRTLLAVDGVDGSGKSVLARRLVQAASDAGIAAVVMAVDDFRRPVDWNASTSRRSETDLYYDDYYDLPKLNDCLAAFVGGAASVQIPTFDDGAHCLAEPRPLIFGAARLAIVEGVFVRRIEAVAAGAASIFLRTSFAEARRRVIARDTARGRTLADVEHRIAVRYFPSQARYLDAYAPEAHADVVIDNEILGAPRITRFDAAALENKLRMGATVPGLAGVLRRTLDDFAPPSALG